MNNLSIIQYLPLTRARATLRCLKKLDSRRVHSILDLEDSAQDPFDENNTKILKQSARQGLVEIAKRFDWDIQTKIYVRINSNKSEYYEEDVEAIHRVCKSKMPISGVFLPKVESYSQIQELNSVLPKGQKLEIVPMVETKSGYKNIESILEVDHVKNLFSKVHYGHFDYCLDANIWPFTDPNHREFWEIVTPLVKLIARHGKIFIHTPFPFPKNETLFWEATSYLSKIVPELEVWSCTLNIELALTKCKDLTLDFVGLDYDESKLVEIAVQISDDFLNSRASKRSFSVTDSRFIPPHQFFGAQNFLDKVNGRGK